MTAASKATSTSSASGPWRSPANSRFAGSDGGAEQWASLASLIETTKLGDIDPQAYIASVISRIVAGHPQSQIDQLMPRNCPAQPAVV